jgi:hypothetical protein
MSKKDRHHPPRIGEKLFRWILPESEKNTLLGDYEELYKDLADRMGHIISQSLVWFADCSHHSDNILKFNQMECRHVP